jgi:hypothetical protein
MNLLLIESLEMLAGHPSAAEAIVFALRLLQDSRGPVKIRLDGCPDRPFTIQVIERDGTVHTFLQTASEISPPGA